MGGVERSALSMYRIALVRLLVKERIMLSFDAAVSGSAVDSCVWVVLTVELRERGLTVTGAPAFGARSAPMRCGDGKGDLACGGPPVAFRLSNETRESMEDVLPRWTFVSTNPEAAESVLPLDERTDAPSSSCRIRPAVRTASGMPVTCPSTAAMLTSTAGFAHAEGGAALFVMRETDANDDDCPLCGLSTGTLCRSTSRNDSSAVGSRGCSLRVTTAEYASGSCHTESSQSGSGLWEDPKNLKDDVLLEADDRPSDDIVFCRGAVGGIGGFDDIVDACNVRGFIRFASSR